MKFVKTTIKLLIVLFIVFSVSSGLFFLCQNGTDEILWEVFSVSDNMTGKISKSAIIKKTFQNFLKVNMSGKTPEFIIGDPGPGRKLKVITMLGVKTIIGFNPRPLEETGEIFMQIDNKNLYVLQALYDSERKIYRNFEMLYAWEKLFDEMKAGLQIRIRLFDGKEIEYSLMGFTKAFNICCQ